VTDAPAAIDVVEPDAEETVAGALVAGTETEEGGDGSLADVDSLFARIRAGQTEATIEPQPAAAPTESADGAGAGAPTTEAPAPEADTSAPVESEVEPEAPEPDSRQVWRSRRAEVLDPLLVVVSKRAKRAAQDDQNALLDGVRRHKGRPTSAQVLVPEPELVRAWAAVVKDALDESYGAGRIAVGGETAGADDALVREAAETIVLPLRQRIASAIDTGEEGDTSGLVERIGARFREWKNQSLEESLVDALARAWSRGVYDASPEGAVLRWIPEVEGRCADCDDNGLEPTVKGSSFPTGQYHPPAHPGCRCLLAPSDT
jgi:hypothetical protein